MSRTHRSADSAQLGCYVESMLAAAQRVFDDELQEASKRRHVIQMYDPVELEQFNEFWSTDRGDGACNSRKVLANLEKRPPHWPCSPLPEDANLCALADAFPNFAEPVEHVRRAAALANLAPGNRLTLSPMLLDGPPGVGKSAFARALAAALNAPLLQFSMTQATASFGLAGLNAQYSAGGPGYLVRSVVDSGAPDSLVIIDELDKASVGANHDPTLPLHDLLEPSTASRFVDDGLRMPMNLSGLRWICTCNDSTLIGAPLLSRCLLFHVAPPTPAQMRRIASKVYSDIVVSSDWTGHFDEDLPPAVADELAEAVPRDLARVIRDALGAAALAGRTTIGVGDLQARQRSTLRRIGFT